MIQNLLLFQMSLHVFMTRIPSLTLQIIKSRKRLALIPTISSAIVTFSKPSDVIQSRAIQSMLFFPLKNQKIMGYFEFIMLKVNSTLTILYVVIQSYVLSYVLRLSRTSTKAQRKRLSTWKVFCNASDLN